MSRGFFPVLLLGRLFSDPLCSAAEPPHRVRSPQMVGPLRLVQFRVISGRFAITSQHNGRSFSSSTKSNGRDENLSINLSDGMPQMRYELGTADERIVIATAQGSELTVRREPRGDSKEQFLELAQPAHGALSLAIGGKDATDARTVRAASIWHLALAEPEIVPQHVLPLLEILHPDWKLATIAGKLESTMLQIAPQRRAANRQAWSELVADLGSDRYATRIAADRKLRSAGAAVAPYLNGLERDRLTPEQLLSVRRIVTVLARNISDDTAERVADWLAWDPQAWFVLLSREDETVRRTAADQLALLLDAPLEFDPASEPAVRQRQLEKLQPRFSPRPTNAAVETE